MLRHLWLFSVLFGDCIHGRSEQFRSFFENFTTSMVSVVIALIGFWTTFVKNLEQKRS